MCDLAAACANYLQEAGLCVEAMHAEDGELPEELGAHHQEAIVHVQDHILRALHIMQAFTAVPLGQPAGSQEQEPHSYGPPYVH